MPISMYSLAQIVAKAQSAQDFYAAFQGADEAKRDRRAKEAMEKGRVARETVEEVKEVEDADGIRVNEDGHGSHSGFSDAFERVRKRIEEHKKSREAHPEEDPEQSGRNLDFIA